MNNSSLSSFELKFTNFFIVFLVSVFFLFPGFSGGYTTLADSKQLFFYIASCSYLALMLGFFLVKLLRGYKPSLSAAQIFMLAYIVLTWVSAFLSQYFPKTILGISRGEGALTITIYGLLFIFISRFGRPDLKLLQVFSICVILFCVLGMIQFAGLNPFYLYPEGYNYHDANIEYFGQFLGTIGNVDLVSAFLCPSTALLLTAGLHLKGKDRILPLIASALGLFILYKIYVKSGLLGLALGLLISVPFQLRITRRARKILILSLVILLFLSIIFLYLYDVPIGMFHEIHEILHGNFNPNFGTGRIKIWTETLKKMPGHWLLGYGPDTMLLAEIEPWENYLPQFNSYAKAYIDAAHNEYLNILFHQGLPALVCFLGSILAVLFNVIRKNDFSVAKLSLLSFVICFCIQAFFNISSCMSSLYFYIALGLIAHEE